MINFCSPSLDPSVATDAACSDGHEVTNLVSKDVVKRKRGFLAYYAMKPPVTITINFACNVNVSHLILWPQIGAQKSSGFEISATSSSKRTGKEPQQYDRVAYGILENNDVGILFYRRVYYTEYSNNTAHLQNFSRRTFLGQASSLLNSVTSLQIKIIKTNSSVPALAKVEVWGYPSNSCDKTLRQNIIKLWENETVRKRDVSHPVVEFQNKSQTLFTSNIKSRIEGLDVEIPEEFLDPITCSLMVLPVVLPSGKIVDQTTLDKHKESEANWGRPPCDPYTGKPFTGSCFPVPASALKSRIDRFLVEHCDKPELQNVPRTVGRKEVSYVPASRCVYYGEQNAYQLFPQTSTVPSSSATCTNSERKRPVDVNEDVVKRKAVKLVQNTFDNHSVQVLNQNSSSQFSRTALHFPPPSGFYDRVKDLCATCQNKDMLFKLPCFHFVCRSCLLTKKETGELFCSACRKVFSVTDPVRHHH